MQVSQTAERVIQVELSPWFEHNIEVIFSAQLTPFGVLYFFLIQLTHRVGDTNLVKCGTLNLFGLVGDTSPQVGQPTAISINRNMTTALSLQC